MQGSLFAVLIGGGFIAFSIKKLADFRHSFAQAEQSGEMEQILSDFENDKRAFKKTVIIGDKYIFGKHCGKIIKIDDIARVYQYIEKDAMGERLRRLRIVFERGEKTDLGRIPLRGKGNSEMEEVFDYLKEKNSFIMLGFIREQ